MNDASEKLLSEIRDIQSELLTLHKADVERRKKYLEAVKRMMIAASVLLGIMLAVLFYLLYTLANLPPLPKS